MRNMLFNLFISLKMSLDLPHLAGVLTHMLRWESGRASFKTVRGSVIGPGAATVSEHIFTSGVPTPAKETAHMGLYSYRHSQSPSHQPVEVVD